MIMFVYVVAGTLAVNVLANTKKFVGGIGKATKSLKGFQGKIGGMLGGGGALGGFMTGLVGIAGLRGLKGMVTGVIDTTDRLNKLSTQIGIGTAELSLFVHQADLAGVSQETLEKSFKKMQRVLVDAGSGLKTAQRPFERLNLSFAELVEMKPGEAFLEISKAMRKMRNPTLRAATAMEIFGRSGSEMIPFFEQNLFKIKRQFDALNASLGPEAANKMSALKDEVALTSLAFTVMKRNAVEALTELLLPAAQGATILAESAVAGNKIHAARKAAKRKAKGGFEAGELTFEERRGMGQANMQKMFSAQGGLTGGGLSMIPGKNLLNLLQMQGAFGRGIMGQSGAELGRPQTSFAGSGGVATPTEVIVVEDKSSQPTTAEF